MDTEMASAEDNTSHLLHHTTSARPRAAQPLSEDEQKFRNNLRAVTAVSKIDEHFVSITDDSRKAQLLAEALRDALHDMGRRSRPKRKLAMQRAMRLFHLGADPFRLVSLTTTYVGDDLAIGEFGICVTNDGELLTASEHRDSNTSRSAVAEAREVDSITFAENLCVMKRVNECRSVVKDLAVTIHALKFGVPGAHHDGEAVQAGEPAEELFAVQAGGEDVEYGDLAAGPDGFAAGEPGAAAAAAAELAVVPNQAVGHEEGATVDGGQAIGPVDVGHEPTIKPAEAVAPADADTEAQQQMQVESAPVVPASPAPMQSVDLDSIASPAPRAAATGAGAAAEVEEQPHTSRKRDREEDEIVVLDDDDEPSAAGHGTAGASSPETAAPGGVAAMAVPKQLSPKRQKTLDGAVAKVNGKSGWHYGDPAKRAATAGDEQRVQEATDALHRRGACVPTTTAAARATDETATGAAGASSSSAGASSSAGPSPSALAAMFAKPVADVSPFETDIWPMIQHRAGLVRQLTQLEQDGASSSAGAGSSSSSSSSSSSTAQQLRQELADDALLHAVEAACAHNDQGVSANLASNMRREARDKLLDFLTSLPGKVSPNEYKRMSDAWGEGKTCLPVVTDRATGQAVTMSRELKVQLIDLQKVRIKAEEIINRRTKLKPVVPAATAVNPKPTAKPRTSASSAKAQRKPAIASAGTAGHLHIGPIVLDDKAKRIPAGSSGHVGGVVPLGLLGRR